MSAAEATAEMGIPTEVNNDRLAAEAFNTVNAQEFLDAMPSAAVVFDDALRIVAVNRRSAELIGYNPAHSIGRPLEGIFRTMFERYQRLQTVERDPRFEHHFNGSWYIVRVFPLTGAGRMSMRCIVAGDISIRKAAEFEARENEARLEEATRIAHLGTFKVVWDSEHVEWSPHMYVLHDVSTEFYDTTISNYRAFIHPGDRDHSERIYLDMIAGKAVRDAEYRILRSDGAVRWLRIDTRVLFDADGVPYGSFGVTQDITESKNREQELNDLLRRNATLYEALEVSPIGVAVLTRENERLDFLYLNAEFQRLSLHNSFSLRGHGLETLRPDGNVEAAWENALAALSSSSDGSFEMTCRRRDDTTFLARLEIAPVLDFPGREAVAYVLNLRDITVDRQRAAAMLQSQKMEALGQLSGGVAHEINNLLQPIIALSELGMNIAQSDPVKVQRYLDVIGNSGRKARDIVRQVLTFARRDTPDVASHAIAPLISGALDLAQSGLPPGIALTRYITTGETRAVVNPTQLSQVVLNLIRNAADATDGRGEIKVSLAAVEIDEIEAGRLDIKPGAWLLLVVADRGCGMDHYTVSRIFEPFFTTKPVGSGTGLGLSVVYSVVTGWGGSVRIESEVDKGTSAMVYIPVDPDSARDSGASDVAGSG